MQLSTVLRRHLGSMLLLAGPILVSQYAYLASGMADTVMSGMLGTVFQAGVAVGAAVWVPVQMFVTGVLYGVITAVATLLRRGRRSCVVQVDVTDEAGARLALFTANFACVGDDYRK